MSDFRVIPASARIAADTDVLRLSGSRFHPGAIREMMRIYSATVTVSSEIGIVFPGIPGGVLI
jgi:hypothetical protein